MRVRVKSDTLNSSCTTQHFTHCSHHVLMLWLQTVRYTCGMAPPLDIRAFDLLGKLWQPFCSLDFPNLPLSVSWSFAFYYHTDGLASTMSLPLPSEECEAIMENFTSKGSKPSSIAQPHHTFPSFT